MWYTYTVYTFIELFKRRRRRRDELTQLQIEKLKVSKKNTYTIDTLGCTHAFSTGIYGSKTQNTLQYMSILYT